MALNKKVAIEVEIKNIEKISKLKKELKAMRAEMKATEELTASGVKLTKEQAAQYSKTATNVKHYSSETRKLNKDLRDSNDNTKKVTKSSNGMAKQFIKGAAAIGIVVTAFRTISRVITSVISTFSEFEFVMAKVQAVSGATNKEFEELTASAQDLGRTTFFTAAQVGQLQLNFSKLGFSAKEIMDAQKATLDLATATGSDLARSATVAGAAVRGFGLEASDTQRVVDVMAVSFASSAMDIEKWQTSMTKVAPIAKSAGFSIEDTAAIMSKLTDSGIEASIAGTSLRNILLKMQDPSSDLTKTFGRTIHSLDDLVPAMKKFVAEGGSMAKVMEIVDVRQVAAFEQMLTTADGTLELRDALLLANGEGARMAGIVGDTMQGAFLKFKSAMQGLSIVVLDFVGRPFTKLIEGFADLFNNITKFIEAPLSETLELDRLKLIEYELKLKDVNISEENRKKLIIDLKREYPDYLAHLDSEKSTNEEITKSLKGLNEQLVNKIIIQKEDEKIQIQALDISERKSRMIEREEILTESLAKLADKYNITLQDGLSLEEQALRIRDEVANSTIKVTEALGRRKELQNFGHEIYNLQQSVKNYNLESAKGVRIEAEKEKLMVRLGMILPDITEKEEEKTKVVVASTDAIKDNTKAKADNRIETELIAEANRDYMDIMSLVLNKTMTLKEAEEALRLEKIKAIEDAIAAMPLIYTDLETREKLERQLMELRLKGLKDEENSRKEQIDGMSTVGKQLIDLAGNDKKYQKIREAGIKISAAAALANNLEALSLQMKGLSASLSEPFPLNIIAVASTLALLMSIKSNMDALSGGKMAKGGMIEEFADGGMVHGRSHAQGGEKFAVGGRVAELEGGEAVINKRSTSMFKGQLSAMNAAGGGVKFADGGLMNMPSFASSQFDAMGQQSMMGAMNQSSKVVVVEADITTSQNTVGVIEAEATF